jgi:hypothetical protein
MLRAAPVVSAVLLVLLTVACAEPPSKEMNQAQGAIDTARAAGAATYAPEEFAAAVEALERAELAVTENDHRLALNHAIDSRERAQAAAAQAVEARAQARGAAERAVAEVATLVGRARARLGDPEVARLPLRDRRGPEDTIVVAEKSLQEARAALEADAYQQAIDLTEGVAAQITDALRALDMAAAGSAGRRPR